VKAATEIIASFSKGKFPKALECMPGTQAYRSAWETTINAAEKHNNPGKFTAFIGYEWTSNKAGNNLHRVVIYRDNGHKASMMEPYTTLPPLGSPNPRDLWKWLERYEEKTGGRILAIAHNGNLSNGIMFPVVDPETGKARERAFSCATRRSICRGPAHRRCHKRQMSSRRCWAMSTGVWSSPKNARCTTGWLSPWTNR